MDVFVLCGQSNMSGRAPFELNESAQDFDQQILFLEGIGTSSSWKVARDPLHSCVDCEEIRLLCGSLSQAYPGVGPGIPFARKVIRLFPRELECQDTLTSVRRVGLIPTAVGGTSIEHWCPGGVLFARMLEQIRIGLQIADNARLRGILFHQGESDACTAELASIYSVRLMAFIEGLRFHLRNDIPIVICAIGGSDRRMPFKPLVREAQFSAESKFDVLGCVETGDLEFQQDGLHLTRNAQNILGERLAVAWSQLAT